MKKWQRKAEEETLSERPGETQHCMASRLYAPLRLTGGAMAAWRFSGVSIRNAVAGKRWRGEAGNSNIALFISATHGCIANNSNIVSLSAKYMKHAQYIYRYNTSRNIKRQA